MKDKDEYPKAKLVEIRKKEKPDYHKENDIPLTGVEISPTSPTTPEGVLYNAVIEEFTIHKIDAEIIIVEEEWNKIKTYLETLGATTELEE